MRRITIWITITLVAAALMTAYQLNTSGVGGRPGEEDRPSSSSTVAPPEFVRSPPLPSGSLWSAEPPLQLTPTRWHPLHA
jgi:hypothetical protein